MENPLMESMARLKILIVEDQVESRVTLKSMLSDLGVTRVLEANDGRIGAQLIGRANAGMDLILCDWNMPVMSGMDFFRHIRGQGNKTPFIIITGRCDQNSVMEARDAGINGYVLKPFCPQQIEIKLRIITARVKTA
jgi:two-component system chemotaxis response regulator CheY